MKNSNVRSAFILGVLIALGLSVLGFSLGNAAIKYREFERTVRVKGLSEKEYPADVIIWPIEFSVAGNQLGSLYESVDNNTSKIKDFLLKNGIQSSEISVSSPDITDKSAQRYASNRKAEFRYTAQQTVTVYSKQVDKVRGVMGSLSELGKQGIVFSGDGYNARTEYLFTRLNKVKPEMIEEATKNAREVAKKFAFDSKSRLGKIKTASQGQFSISQRDRNNPQIKKVRVVSTVTYYLSD